MIGLLDYRRHFTRLLAVSIGLVALEAALGALAPEVARSSGGVELEFAAYGALHALTLISSLRTRLARLHQAAFVAVAAALSLAVAALGLVLLKAQLGGPVPVLAATAALGALTYAGAIGGVLGGVRSELRAGRAAALAAPLCAVAVAAAYPLARHVGALGLVFALPWWLAFSGALWFAGPRHVSASK